MRVQRGVGRKLMPGCICGSPLGRVAMAMVITVRDENDDGERGVRFRMRVSLSICVLLGTKFH